MATESSELFETLWKRVDEAWDDDRSHSAALEHAIAFHRLPELAGRYRALQDHPERGARAKQRIDAIVIAATQLLMQTKSEPASKIARVWTGVLPVMSVLVAASVVTWLALQLLRGR